MQVQHDDAAQADRLIIDYVRQHGPITMEHLVRTLVSLSWAQVFSAVDRLSRTGRIQLHQTRQRDYLVGMRASFIPPHVLMGVVAANDVPPGHRVRT